LCLFIKEFIFDKIHNAITYININLSTKVVFTNDKLDEHISKLSVDRWLRLHINYDYSIEFRKDNGDGTVTPVSLDKLNIKK